MGVSEVMTRRVITVTPETRMSELREILRTNRISGTPVVSEGRLVGIISIEDFINWMAKGCGKATVAQRMTMDVTTVFEDEPLVRVVNTLERYGFGRLPVVRREHGELVGLVTKGDIVEGLLRKLEIGFHEQEVGEAHDNRLFNDIIAGKNGLVLRYQVTGGDFREAGTGATRLKESLRRLGVDPIVLRRVAIIAYEAEMNIVIYAKSGELLAKVEPGSITIEARDHGPGIPDVELALTPGYSTATDWVRELGFGAGMGLCNIKQCADDMRLDSVVGKGTRLEAKIVLEEGSA